MFHQISFEFCFVFKLRRWFFRLSTSSETTSTSTTTFNTSSRRIQTKSTLDATTNNSSAIKSSFFPSTIPAIINDPQLSPFSAENSGPSTNIGNASNALINFPDEELNAITVVEEKDYEYPDWNKEVQTKIDLSSTTVQPTTTENSGKSFNPKHLKLICLLC